MVMNGVISRVTIHIRGLITPITTHEPPSIARHNYKKHPKRDPTLENYACKVGRG